MPHSDRTRRADPFPPIGWVLSVDGRMVDVYFGDAGLPRLHTVLEVAWASPEDLTLEVQQHLDRTSLRAVACRPVVGLSRNTAVQATGRHARVPRLRSRGL